MSKKSSKKFNIILYLLVLIFVFVMFMATSYAYYTKTSKEKDKNIVYNELLMSINYEGKDQLNVVNIRPGWEDSLTFTINNFSEDTIGKYKLVFEIITPLSNMMEEYFTYDLEGISESKDKTNSTINNTNVVVPVASKELEGGIITPKNVHTYKLNIRLDKKVNAKKYPKGSIFSARVKLVSVND